MGDQTPPNSDSSHSILKSAAAMSLGTLISRILGYLRDSIINALFPLTVRDAYYVAFRLPNLFRRVLGEGALSVSFIPVFVEEHNKGKEEAMRLAGAVYSLLNLITGTMCLLGVYFMPEIIARWVSGQGYQAIPGKVDLTVFLARIMFVYLYLVTSYAFLMAISNTRKKFFLPAMAQGAFNLVAIVFSLVPPEWGRQLGEFLAWGVVVGGVLQTGLVVLQLRGLGYMPQWTRIWRVSGLRQVFLNMAPGALGLSILQIMGIANVYFASRLEEGSHSYLYLADRLLELPQSLLAVSLGAALLPSLSELWSRGERSKLCEQVSENQVLVTYLSLPASLGLFLLAEPIVECLFQYGAFSSSDVATTASVVRIDALVLIASSINRVQVAGFYAVKNTWLPAVVSAVTLFVHLVVANSWVELFGIRGLAGSVAFVAFLNVVLTGVAFRRMVGPMAIGRLLTHLLKLLPALLTMAVSLELASRIPLENLSHLIPWEVLRLVRLGVLIFIGAGAYFFLSGWTHPRESQLVRSLFSRTR